MAIIDQLKRLKENWFLVLMPFVLIFVLVIGVSGISLLTESGFSTTTSEALGGYGQSGRVSYDYASQSVPNAEYAPISASKSASTALVAASEVKDQMVAKTASLSTEVEQGKFFAEEATLKSIVQASDAYLLDQNVNTYGSGTAEYKVGYYQIKVDSKKYDAIIPQLKALGKMVTFNENAQDVTETYTDLGIRVENEKKRLQRYEEMYAQASTVDEKINLNDRIFNQENTIKYLEDSLKDVGERVVYSTISVTITEEQSGYAELTFVNLSDLVQILVGSLSALLWIFVAVLPWALGIWLIIFVVRKIRKPKHLFSKK